MRKHLNFPTSDEAYPCLLITGALVMVTKQLSIPTAIAISICIGSWLARSDVKTFAPAPATGTGIDFDQVFADATRQGEPINSGRAPPRPLERQPCHYRFRENRSHAPDQLVETRRADGKVHDEHVASLGSIRLTPSIEAVVLGEGQRSAQQVG
jgi:hypothetical protein